MLLLMHSARPMHALGTTNRPTGCMHCPQTPPQTDVDVARSREDRTASSRNGLPASAREDTNEQIPLPTRATRASFALRENEDRHAIHLPKKKPHRPTTRSTSRPRSSDK